MSIPQLDTRVTPSLHPANVTNLDGYSDVTKGYVEGAERALREAYDGVAAVFDAGNLLGNRGGMMFAALESAVGAKPHEVQALRLAKARADKALAV